MRHDLLKKSRKYSRTRLLLGCSTVLLLVIAQTFQRAPHSPQTAVILTVSSNSGSHALRQLAMKTLFEDITRFPDLYQPVLVYEDENGDWTPEINGTTRIRSSRSAEIESFGESFNLFSGIYGASVKPAALRWLAEQAEASIKEAWIIEPDIVYAGASWSELFEKFVLTRADLIAFNTTFRYNGNKTAWNHWRDCTYCDFFNVPDWQLQAALLPAFRISKSLAKSLVSELTLYSRGTSAHHECMVPTFTTIKSERFSWIDLSKADVVGYIKWRPVITDEMLPENLTTIRGKLYHPIKSPAIFARVASQRLITQYKK